MVRGKWWAVPVGVAALVLMVAGMQARAAVPAQNREPAVVAQVLIDGQVAGSFSDVSGLGSELEQVVMLCPVKGGDGDCDDADGIEWEASARKALWEIDAAADEMERSAWVSSRASHDVAMNAVRNLKGIVKQTNDSLNGPEADSRRFHEMAKSVIGNIRAIVRVLADVTANEPGVDQASMYRISRSVDALQALSTEWTVRKRPGRPVYGNITFEAARGSAGPLVEWYERVLAGQTDRKSGSIIYLDRTGNEVARYNFFEAWPVRYEASMAIEKIEIAVEKVERAK
jgi:phage tail-like protein